jgi:uncharacterized protein (DUF305 family)
MTEDIEALTGADPFDAAFIDTMIEHHTSAIDAAQVVLAAAARSEIRSLAEDIIASQEAEIEQLETWREMWYPAAP